MTEPLFPAEPKLTPRQQACLNLVASGSGVPADAIGANWHSLRGRHSADARCEWCAVDGRDVVRSRALHGLVTYRRTRDGNMYVLRGRGGETSRDGQLSHLPGDSWEDIFGGAA